MNSRIELGFFVAAVIGVIFITALVTAFPTVNRSEAEAAEGMTGQPALPYQQSDPTLLVPESTMGEQPQRYQPHWESNPVATLPESTMGATLQRYPHDWDNNPVATVPESTMID